MTAFCHQGCSVTGSPDLCNSPPQAIVTNRSELVQSVTAHPSSDQRGQAGSLPRSDPAPAGTGPSDAHRGASTSLASEQYPGAQRITNQEKPESQIARNQAPNSTFLQNRLLTRSDLSQSHGEIRILHGRLNHASGDTINNEPGISEITP